MSVSKKLLFYLTLFVILASASATLIINYDPNRSKDKIELETAINQAKHVYKIRKETGGDLSSGPCLSESLMPGWVLDIAHNPRLPIDDLPANQCQNYLRGIAKHFVELDEEGNLIRAK